MKPFSVVDFQGVDARLRKTPSTGVCRTSNALVKRSRPGRAGQVRPGEIGTAYTSAEAVQRRNGLEDIVIAGAERAFCSGGDRLRVNLRAIKTEEGPVVVLHSKRDIPRLRDEYVRCYYADPTRLQG